jgi:predicted transcriptional regulator
MIQVKKETAERLRRLKDYGRQSYDELINKLILAEESETLTEQDIAEIKQGLDDIKAGRTRPIEAVAKELGIKLRG